MTRDFPIFSAPQHFSTHMPNSGALPLLIKNIAYFSLQHLRFYSWKFLKGLKENHSNNNIWKNYLIYNKSTQQMIEKD